MKSPFRADSIPIFFSFFISFFSFFLAFLAFLAFLGWFLIWKYLESAATASSSSWLSTGIRLRVERCVQLTAPIVSIWPYPAIKEKTRAIILPPQFIDRSTSFCFCVGLNATGRRNRNTDQVGVGDQKWFHWEWNSASAVKGSHRDQPMGDRLLLMSLCYEAV